MEIDTFRKWLEERGCHFDTQRHRRGEGHGHLTIHREGRTAELPLRTITWMRIWFAKSVRR